MSLKDLTKEQKQYVALGLLAASIVAILMVLGIRFSMATVSTAKQELDDLSGKISKANRALSRSRQTSEDYVETVSVLRDYLTNAPPDRNYYSWATEVIYSTARFAGLEIDSIDEISIPQRKRSGSDGPAVISFESYSLRIMAHGGYENTKYFLNLLNQDYPLVRFSGVEISRGQNRDKHDIQLFIQWPFNFGEISKNWDAVASKKMEVAEINDGEEAAALKEPEPVEKPAAPEPSIAKPISVVEPYPPTTLPEVRETPVPEPMVEPTAPKTQPGGESGSQVTPSSEDTVPKPATDDELEALLSYATPSGTEIMGAEPQSAITGPEPMEEPVPAPDEPQFDAMDAEPKTDTSSELEIDFEPETSIDPQPDSIADDIHDNVSTGKSEKNLEERLNQESAEEDISMSSLLQDMMGKNNEK